MPVLYGLVNGAPDPRSFTRYRASEFLGSLGVSQSTGIKGLWLTTNIITIKDIDNFSSTFEPYANIVLIHRSNNYLNERKSKL